MMSAMLLLLVGFVVGAEPAAADVAAAITTADEHRQAGRYAEAIEAYDALAEQTMEPAQRSAVAIGWSLALEETGEWQEATDLLRAAVEQAPDGAIWARLAELEYRQGRYDAAQLAVDAALKLDTNAAAARVIQAHLLRETGQFDKAIAAYLWCVRQYNRTQPKDAPTLLALAEGSLEYARWKQAAKIFDFVVNTLCPEAIKNDPHYWQAYALSGGLLLEKYNQAQAETELNRALAINPHSARVLVLLGQRAMGDLKFEQATDFADRALEVNPHSPDALMLKADLALANGEPTAAREFVTQALAINAADQRIRAREAVCCLLEDGVPPESELLDLFLHLDAIQKYEAEKPSRFTQILVDVAKRNPRPGEFLSIVGEALDAQRMYESAEDFYRQAIVVMPQLAAPRANLAMLFMRTGRIDDAGKMLNEAFKLDPFHVRVSNMRKVVGVLGGYETISTDHFLIKCDRTDTLQARLMGRKLEGEYAELTERYGYEPAARTPFELYAAAEGQSAHEWFSARMVGLPWVQTIGASTGMIVALASPTQREPYNWAHVVRHEFVHILTLQKTNYQIPHWFTEALAVTEEGIGLPEEWQVLLLNRVPRGEIFTLATLNGGFQRPRDGDDWQMAYCQSALYAKYMQERFGEDAPVKLLNEFCKTRDTEAAIKQAFGVEVADFEDGYVKLLVRTVEELRSQRSPARPTLAAAKAAHEADPNDPDAAGRYAWALARAEQFQTARELAEKVNKEKPSQPDAAYLLARYALTQNYEEKATELLTAALDEASPHSEVLNLLARLKLDDKQNDEAAKLFRIGTEKFPLENRFWNGLTRSIWNTADDATLRPILERIAARDFDNSVVRKRLAQMALKAENYEEAVRWGEDALCIDIEDADVHRLLAECYGKLNRAEDAKEAWQAVLTLVPEDAAAKERVGKSDK